MSGAPTSGLFNEEETDGPGRFLKEKTEVDSHTVRFFFRAFAVRSEGESEGKELYKYRNT